MEEIRRSPVEVGSLSLRTFQQDPWSMGPQTSNQPTVYVSEFLSFGGWKGMSGVCETGVCWGSLRLSHKYIPIPYIQLITAHLNITIPKRSPAEWPGLRRFKTTIPRWLFFPKILNHQQSTGVKDRFPKFILVGYMWLYSIFFNYILTWPMAKRLKLLGITYLVGKISRSNFFFQGPLAKWVYYYIFETWFWWVSCT